MVNSPGTVIVIFDDDHRICYSLRGLLSQSVGEFSAWAAPAPLTLHFSWEPGTINSQEQGLVTPKI